MCSWISWRTWSRKAPLISFRLGGVDPKTVEEVPKRFFELIKKTASGPLDMTRLMSSIKRTIKMKKLEAETDMLSLSSISRIDHVHGPRDGRVLRSATENLKIFRTLEAWKENQFQQFIRTLLLDVPHVAILGVASLKLEATITIQERARIQKRLEIMGEKGMEKNIEEVNRFKKENNTPIPLTYFQALRVPDPDEIAFIQSSTAKSGLWRPNVSNCNTIQLYVDEDGCDVPVSVHFETFNSHFIYIKVILPTYHLNDRLKQLLPLYKGMFFESSIRKEPSIIVGWQEVMKELDECLVSRSIDIGNAQHSEVLVINMTMEPVNYEIAINMLYLLAFSSISDDIRCKSVLDRISGTIKTTLMDDFKMAQSITDMITSDPQSCARYNSELIILSWATAFMEKLQKNALDMQQLFDSISCSLLDCSNMRVYVGGNIQGLTRPISPWKIFTPNGYEKLAQPLQLREIPHQVKFWQTQKPGRIAILSPMPSTASAAGYFTGVAPHDPDDQFLPAYTVAIAYLNIIEGPIWVACRSSGYAYRCKFTRDSSRGLVSLEFNKCSNIWKAYDAARKVVSSLAFGSQIVDRFYLEGAKSSLWLDKALSNSTSQMAAENKALEQIVGRNMNSTTFLKKTQTVTAEEVQLMMKMFVLPTLLPDTCNMVITCSVKDAMVCFVQPSRMN
jgi:Zn-dependent M16 (insulinase) family peptidase